MTKTRTPEINGGARNTLQACTLKELFSIDFPESKWSVDGLVESGALTMVSALWGQRKSWVCLHFAICIANGTPVFGVFDTEQQTVLIINEEDSERQIQERMHILSPPSEELPIYFLVGQGFNLSNKNIVWLHALIKKKNIGVIIIDSLRAVHSLNENESSEMQAVMDQLKKLANAGLSVIFTHHSRKPSQNRQSADSNGEETRGSGAINAAVHGHLALEAISNPDGQEQIIVHQRKSKSAEKIASFKVRVDKASDGTLSFIHEGEYSDEAIITKTSQSILTGLRANKQWMSIRDLIAIGFAKERAIRAALKTMEHDKKLSVTTRANTKNLPGTGALNEKFYMAIPSGNT